MTPSAFRTIVIAAPPTVYGVLPAIQPGLRWPMTGPLQILDYSIDATAQLLDVSDTIVSATAAVQPSGSGELAPLALSVLGGLVTVWLGPGVAGRYYRVHLTATTNGEHTFEWMVGLMVDPALAANPLPAPSSPGFGTPITWDPDVMANPPLGLVDTVTAIGADQASALVLSSLTNIIVAGAAATGVKMPNTVVSGTIVVVNATGIDHIVYPQSGGTIGNGGPNVGVIISPGQRLAFATEQPGTQWFAG